MTIKVNHPTGVPIRPVPRPPTHPKDITLAISWTPQGMQFKASRATNAIELASLALAICGSQLQIIAESMNKPVEPIHNRNEPHDYVINEHSAASIAGNACGLCGRTNMDTLHLPAENEAGDGQ